MRIPMHFWVPIRRMGIDVKVCAAPICEGRYRAAGRAGESGAGEGRKGEAEGRKGGGRKGPPLYPPPHLWPVVLNLEYLHLPDEPCQFGKGENSLTVASLIF